MSDSKKSSENGVKKKTCFVIMPFSDPPDYEKGHFDKIYSNIFKPAIESAGYEAQRTDDNLSSSSILAKIIKGLIEADMVLCDLSTKNPNVLYELGIRQAFDKPVVLVHKKDSKHIFDVSYITTHAYRKERRYDEVPADQETIKKAILATEEDPGDGSIMKLARVEKSKAEELAKLPSEQAELIESLVRDVESLKKTISQKQVLRNNDRDRQLTADNIKDIVYYLKTHVDPENLNMPLTQHEIVNRFGITPINAEKIINFYKNYDFIH